jgi:ammonia channel protein AmtB
MLWKLIGVFIPLRAGRDDESMGLDLSQHGEEAYVHSEGAAPAYRTVSAT